LKNQHKHDYQMIY